MLQQKNWPNLLTCLRIMTVPAIIASFYLDNSFIGPKTSALLFLLASITDFLDGYIARKYKLESKLGKILDPIADKILVSTVLIVLVKANIANELLCCIIIAREIIASGIREFAATQHVKINVYLVSKFKTLTQMVAILLILCSRFMMQEDCLYLGNLFLWAAALLSIITIFWYIKSVRSDTQS